jgi:glycosyltransferase involved in cell wall biosynthesis
MGLQSLWEAATAARVPELREHKAADERADVLRCNPMTPRVSIVTTVYDRVDCLARCLRAVQHLTYRDVEQIVVSDCPPADVVDQIAALCDQAGVRHINLPQRMHDWGISPAMAGLRASRGEYVCFLSDDNAYLQEHFGPLVAALDSDPGLGFVYSSCLYAGRRELRHTPPVGAGIDLGQPLFRRSVLRDHFADILPCRGHHSWDWELIRALMNLGVRWQHVDELTFVFRLQAYPKLVEALA